MVSGKDVVVAATAGALYAVFFSLGFVVQVPGFVLLYAPIIWMGVFPMWFGIPGLIGSALGVWAGGAFVEGLGLLGIVEMLYTVPAYLGRYFLMPKGVSEMKRPRDLGAFIGVTLPLDWIFFALLLFGGFVGLLRLFPLEVAQSIYLPVGVANLIILQYIVVPPLLRAVTPILKRSGLYYGSFRERHEAKKSAILPEQPKQM